MNMAAAAEETRPASAAESAESPAPPGGRVAFESVYGPYPGKLVPTSCGTTHYILETPESGLVDSLETPVHDITVDSLLGRASAARTNRRRRPPPLRTPTVATARRSCSCMGSARAP